MLRNNSNHALKTTGMATLGLLSLVGSMALALPVNAAPQPDPGVDEPAVVSLEEDAPALDSQSGATEPGATTEETELDGLEAAEPASRGVARSTLAVSGPSAVVGKCKIPKGSYTGAAATTSMRIQGDTRYATAANIAAHVKAQPLSTGKESALFIASGEDFADGLALSALAAYAGWPVMLTPKGSVSKEVSAYIAANKPTHVYIAGGSGAVSESVQKDIIAKADAASGKSTRLTRFAGSDRYETSLRIAECFDSGVEAFVTTGSNFADAVVAGAPAALKGGPVILTAQNTISSQASAALKTVAPSKVNIIGGTWSAAQKEAASAAAGNKPVKVISGKNRYATSAAVATTFFPGAKTIMFSTGLNFPDALAGVSAAHHNKAPVVLTKTTCRPKDIEAVASSASTHIRLGGSSVVSDRATTATCIPAPVISTSAKVVAAAKAQVGKAYVSAGAGPNVFDCSGLTQYAHKLAGINIPRTTWDQWAQGQKVSSPRPGDIVVLGGGGHVGIYMGSGMMVDAGNPRVGVSYRSIYATPNAYVRFA